MVSTQTQQEMEQVLGSVPSFFDEMPDQIADHIWGGMRDLELSQETAIPPKYKELIGLGIASALHCPYCTHFHSETASMHGATEEELREASSQAMITSAASTFLHGRQADLNRYKKETAQVMDHLKQGR